MSAPTSNSNKRGNKNDDEFDQNKKKRESKNDVVSMIHTKYVDHLINLISAKTIDSDQILEYLERYPNSAKYIGSDGYYPLHFACSNTKCGNDVRMELIELYPFAVSIPGKDGYYPLHMACLNTNKAKDVIIELMQTYPDAAKNSANVTGNFPLNCAMRNVKCQTVIIPLIDLYPKALQHKDLHGYYPIHYVTRNNSSNNIIEHILNLDPLSIQRQDCDGDSPLHMNYRGRLFHYLKRHMIRYSDISINLINMTSNDNYTPLHNACKHGKDDMVEFLLQYPGIDVNAKQKHEYSTPLHCASYYIVHGVPYSSHMKVVRQLLRHQCIIHNDKNMNNETPLDLVNKHIQSIEEDYVSSTSHCQMLSDLKEIKKLLNDLSTKSRWKAFEYLLKPAGAVNVLSRK